jgi:hypothetical protein
MTRWLIILLAATPAWAGDYGRLAGEKNSPEVRAWYNSLLRPDTYPNAHSCCGEGDAYYADATEIIDDKVYAIITDDRPDCLLYEHEKICRAHEEPGTRYLVPPNKILGKESRGNPTGHIIVFLTAPSYAAVEGDQRQRASPREVLCYVPNGGV